MLIGYELLKEGNNEELLQPLFLAGCQKIYSDRCLSGNRAGLEEALEFVNPGDILVVRRLDSLGKTVWSAIKTIHRLLLKGVALKSLEENLSISASSSVIELLETLRGFEEKAIELRVLTREATLQKNGTKKGRPPLKKEIRELAQKMSKEMTVQEVCRHLKISRAAYYNYFPSSKR